MIRQTFRSLLTFFFFLMIAVFCTLSLLFFTLSIALIVWLYQTEFQHTMVMIMMMMNNKRGPERKDSIIEMQSRERIKFN